MPLEFINLIKKFHPPSLEDRGFLISLTKGRWNNSATTEVMNLLRTFAEKYYELKCPEGAQETKADNSTQAFHSQSESPAQEESPDGSGSNKSTRKSYCIQFAIRELVNNSTHCFVACNLADPEDFTNHIFCKLAEENDYPKPKLPFRILPVQRISEAKPKEIEATLLPLMDQTLAKDSDYPHRFSLIYRSESVGGHVSYTEALNLARNCVWAANPNCVQCVKYQDYAVVMTTIEPLFYVGVIRDFQKLASYNTWGIQHGLNEKDAGPDSEDDISDDPTLSEDDNRKRKLRIKRKRHEDKMNQQEHQAAKKRLLEGSDGADNLGCDDNGDIDEYDDNDDDADEIADDEDAEDNIDNIANALNGGD